MHGNLAAAWDVTDSDECPQCKTVRREWHVVMDDTKTIKIRSDGEEVSKTIHSDGEEVSKTTKKPKSKKPKHKK
jgi:hypothetical protein